VQKGANKETDAPLMLRIEYRVEEGRGFFTGLSWAKRRRKENITPLDGYNTFAQANQEHKRRNVLKQSINPLLPLALLTADIKQLICQLSDVERHVLHVTAEDILDPGWLGGKRAKTCGRRH